MAAALEGRNTAGGKAGSERKESIADVGKELGDIYDVDDAVLRAQGHVSELQRSFSWLGGIGLCFRCVW
jgi:choline transport protein